jgi:hypothetical protein
MLQITIPARELWDEYQQVFITSKEQTLQLEHSLVSLRKWESKWCKPFISTKEKTIEETIDYIKCMTITQNVSPDTYRCLTNENLQEINDYIAAPMTATTFSENGKEKPNREVITAELIYYWMIALQIPPQYEKWHLNSLLTLIRVCNIKNQPTKKRSKRDTASSYAQLNAARRKQLNSKG